MQFWCLTLILILQVCELHFRDCDIINKMEYNIIETDENFKAKYEAQHIGLKKDAVPSIFPHYPQYLAEKSTEKPRKSFK